MATRLYLPATAAATGISPTPDSAWEDVSILARAVTSTSKISDAMADVALPDDGDSTSKDVLFRQYVSAALDAGQTITGAQALKAQCRVLEFDNAGNMFFTVGIRVLAGDGTTVQKTVLAVTRDEVEVSSTALTNRQFTATSAATNYTTVANDRLVIEVGMAGDPGAAGTHASTMRLGDAAAADLLEDDLSVLDSNPWVQLTDTLTFAAGGGSTQPPRTMHQFRQRTQA